MANVFVQHQKLYGTAPAKLAPVQPIHSETTVLLVQLQEFGQIINVFVKPRLMFGMETNVFVHKVNTVQTVLNAQPQEDGIQLRINVFATLHSSGTVKIVFVHNHTFYIKENAENAQLDSNGLIINVKNAIAIIKTLKFTPVFENDRFIGLFYY